MCTYKYCDECCFSGGEVFSHVALYLLQPVTSEGAVQAVRIWLGSNSLTVIHERGQARAQK